MYYIISDIHGCQKEFRKALRNWDDEKETLVIMGDFIDRGPDSMGVIKDLMTLTRVYGERVVVLMGNHEEMLISWLKENEANQDFYYNTTHFATLISALGSESVIRVRPRDIAKKMNSLRAKEIEWISNLPLYFEREKFILVHAGVNFDKKDWREDSDYMLWARKEFFYSKTKAEKRVFFGHTPTHFIHDSNEIWISDDKMKVGIDGGVSMNGQLNALKIDEDGEIKEVFCFSKK